MRLETMAARTEAAMPRPIQTLVVALELGALFQEHYGIDLA